MRWIRPKGVTWPDSLPLFILIMTTKEETAKANKIAARLRDLADEVEKIGIYYKRGGEYTFEQSIEDKIYDKLQDINPFLT